LKNNSEDFLTEEEIEQIIESLAEWTDDSFCGPDGSPISLYEAIQYMDYITYILNLKGTIQLEFPFVWWELRRPGNVC